MDGRLIDWDLSRPINLTTFHTNCLSTQLTAQNISQTGQNAFELTLQPAMLPIVQPPPAQHRFALLAPRRNCHCLVCVDGWVKARSRYSMVASTAFHSWWAWPTTVGPKFEVGVQASSTSDSTPVHSSSAVTVCSWLCDRINGLYSRWWLSAEHKNRYAGENNSRRWPEILLTQLISFRSDH